MKIPTLEEFRSSRKEMTWHQAAELLRIDEAYTDAPRAMVYLNRFYIEDFIVNNYDHGNNNIGRYVLVVERDIHYTNDLKFLEQILYEYLRNEEYF